MTPVETIRAIDALLHGQRRALQAAMTRLGGRGGSPLLDDVDEADRLADLMQRRLDDLRLAINRQQESGAK